MNTWMLVDAALIIAAGLISIPWLRDAVEVSRTRVTELPPNNNESAVEEYLDLLGEAEREIVMYDDGDAADGSLYESQAVVEALRAKIADNPEFTVKCVLNDQRRRTLFERKLGALTQVDIRPRRENQGRVHYKIIDGRKAYVSRHGRGDICRARKIIDCTNSQRRNGRPLALQRYFTDFERYA